MIRRAHLNSLKYISENRSLLPLVSLGSVLIAVCGQSAQLVAQIIPVVKLKLLEEQTQFDTVKN